MLSQLKIFLIWHKNLEALAHAYYFSELTDKLIVAPERDENIWALMKRAMGVLDKPCYVIPRLKAEESPANAGNEASHTRGIPLRPLADRNDGLNSVRAGF